MTINLKTIGSAIILLGFLSLLFLPLQKATEVVTESIEHTLNTEFSLVVSQQILQTATSETYTELVKLPPTTHLTDADFGDFNPRNKCFDDFISNGFNLLIATDKAGQPIKWFLTKGAIRMRIDFIRAHGAISEVGMHIVEHFGSQSRYFTFNPGLGKKHLKVVKKSSKPMRPHTHINTNKECLDTFTAILNNL